MPTWPTSSAATTWNAHPAVSILTDFEDSQSMTAAISPTPVTAQAGHLPVMLLRYADYEDQWDESAGRGLLTQKPSSWAR